MSESNLTGFEELAERFEGYASGYSKLHWGDELLAAEMIRGLAAEVNKLNKELREAWWRGVTDQWNHRPIGARLLDTKNPYGFDGPGGNR